LLFQKAKKDKQTGYGEAAELVMIAVHGQEGVDFHEELSLLHKEGKDHLTARNKYNLTDNTYIFDSGATSHMRFSKKGMSNLRPYIVPITIGNAQNIFSEEIGTFHGIVSQPHGRNFTIKLTDVLYIPDLYVNLLSMTKVLQSSHIDIRKEGDTVALIFGLDQKLVFNQIIPVGRGNLIGVQITPADGLSSLPLSARAPEFAFPAISFQDLHAQLGHPHNHAFQLTAKNMELPFQGPPVPCAHCDCAKLRVANIPKESSHVVATRPGQRIMFDVSSVQATSQGGNNQWLLIMDEYTGFCWSIFMKKKSDLPIVMLNLFYAFQKRHCAKV